MSAEDLALKQLSQSGFPFQLRVEHEIVATENQHGWKVETKEHAWAYHVHGLKSGYIDLVLRHNRLAVLRLVVECKRQRDNDARLLQWLFLVRREEAEQTELVRCLTVEGRRQASGTTYIDEHGSQRSSWAILKAWDNVRVSPISYESQFCIMQGDNSKERPLLERLCGELLNSLEGLVEEEITIAKADASSSHIRTFNIPVVVTNAQLNLCILNIGAASLKDGLISPDECKIETVPFLRFRKSLSVMPPGEGEHINSLVTANLARERTVFIVNSEHLTEFLSEWSVKPWDSLNGYALQQLMDKYMGRR